MNKENKIQEILGHKLKECGLKANKNVLRCLTEAMDYYGIWLLDNTPKPPRVYFGRKQKTLDREIYDTLMNQISRLNDNYRKLALSSPSNEQEKKSRNWEEDLPHENGNYQCSCIKCGNFFFGHKRRVVCKVCF